MTEIIWDETYSVGEPILDGQHKTLISQINRLDNIVRDGGDLRDVLDVLEHYVQEHFTLEESMMRDAGYADFEHHVAEHREFETWLRSAQSHLATGGLGTAILAKAIHEHLHEWLLGHILIVDMAYKDKVWAILGTIECEQHVVADGNLVADLHVGQVDA